MQLWGGVVNYSKLKKVLKSRWMNFIFFPMSNHVFQSSSSTSFDLNPSSIVQVVYSLVTNMCFFFIVIGLTFFKLKEWIITLHWNAS